MSASLNYKNIFIVLLVGVGYLLLSDWLIGYKQEQLVLVFIFLSCYFFSTITRKFILGFSVFIVFWILFDYMKAFPNYLYNTVHIEQLYHAEKKLFGFHINNQIVTPNEYWLNNHNHLLDILTGFFYLSWMPVPLVFAAYLFYKNRQHFFYFSLSFLLVNCIGFIVYYIYPAAPPWYVQQYGFDFIAGTPGNTAGLARFDAYFNTTIFKHLYEKSSNVFAAMPSLHASYPLIVLYYGIKFKMGNWNYVFAINTLGIWFAAVYTSHHYILDVLAGIICGITGIFLFLWMLKSSKGFKKLVDHAIISIS
ncbi:MAG: inositol phosphorylceramide synthase [Sphingobacteriia bacterium]|nr:MAG: inositol phosphorylceramide synthase [Sphingobacteriia bacterium]TAG32073.1 MAG: inositol phosphorylceramide synthase [Sphingobacteriia bacterium]TAH09396.1 MAG: inositol phosphorylceramide synthase [Sphingobacteriia bacterium]